MAENPQAVSPRQRPVSPHLTIYRWPVTMATSITHRVTGVALYLGMIFLTWWLMGLASGPDVYQPFVRIAASPLGQLAIFGFLWSLAYHFLNGIRHLAWDLGYGFAVPTANRTAVLVIVVSVLLAVGLFALGYEIQHGAVQL